ncbi:CHAP domain-containing protein [Luteimonas sp. A649]
MSFNSPPPGWTSRPAFPGRVIKLGEADSAIVKLVQERLNFTGCGPLRVSGTFDRDHTERAAKLFQARYTDVTGQPLVVDGKIGSLSWGAMFGEDTTPASAGPPSRLLGDVLDVARRQIGVLEKPLGSNRGPEVDLYLQAVGLRPGRSSYAWCVAFTYFCFDTAARRLGCANPHVRTAGVLDHWNRARDNRAAKRITHTAAVNDPGLVQPGQLFVMDYGGGKGHTGLVLEVANGRLTTIEGNTNDGGSREGIGVFQRDARKIAGVNKGFIDYSAL